MKEYGALGDGILDCLITGGEFSSLNLRALYLFVSDGLLAGLVGLSAFTLQVMFDSGAMDHDDCKCTGKVWVPGSLQGVSCNNGGQE